VTVLRVPDWEQFQHYKVRTPPWIKLYNYLLEDYRFNLLADSAKLHLILIWFLASRIQNVIPNDPEWVRQRIGVKKKPDLENLVEMGFLARASTDKQDAHQPASTDEEGTEQQASEPLAKCLPRGEGEKEERERRAEQIPVSPDGADEDRISEVWDRHLLARKRYFEQKNGRAPSSEPDLTQELRKLIRRSIGRHGFEKTQAAGVGIFYSAHHTGKNDQGSEFLDPALCWRIRKDQNNVEQFAALALEAEDVSRGT